MNFKDFFDSVEELCYELMANLILFVKTIIKLFTDNKFSFEYVNNQFQKDKERFIEYVSPIKFSVYALLIFLLASAKPEDFGFAPIFKPFVELPFYEKGILVFAVTNLIPLTITVIIMLLNKEEITLISLKRPFYILIYSFSSYYLVWIVFALIKLVLAPLDYFQSKFSSFFKSSFGQTLEYFFLLGFVLFFAVSFFYSIYIFFMTMRYSMTQLLSQKKKLSLYFCIALLLLIVVLPKLAAKA